MFCEGTRYITTNDLVSNAIAEGGATLPGDFDGIFTEWGNFSEILQQVEFAPNVVVHQGYTGAHVRDMLGILKSN